MRLPETATMEQASGLLERLDAAVAEAASGSLRIDATGLKEFDTAALALLLHAQRRITAAGGQLAVAGAPAKLHELARLYGVDGLLSFEPT